MMILPLKMMTFVTEHKRAVAKFRKENSALQVRFSIKNDGSSIECDGFFVSNDEFSTKTE